jgi:GGDEF domain-containing protein
MALADHVAAPRARSRRSGPYSACRFAGRYYPIHPELLTFALFETLFLCICAAYLFVSLVKDRIAARHQDIALIDPLTGVANRRGFLQAGERLMIRTRFTNRPAALLTFDLDRFKSINDKFGHPAGDTVLVTFCQLATSQLRPTDLFGRMGGEEFASLLPETTLQDAIWRQSGCVPHSKPPTTRSQSNRLPRQSALASQPRTMRVLISPLCWSLQIRRSIAPRHWAAIVSSCGRMPHSRLLLGKHLGKPLRREFSGLLSRSRWEQVKRDLRAASAALFLHANFNQVSDGF